MSDSTTSYVNLAKWHGSSFGIVPTELIMDTELTPAARLVGVLLLTYRNKDTEQAFPGQPRIAEEPEWTQWYVSKCIAALETRGWLRKTRRIEIDSDWGGNPNACLYEMYDQRQIFPPGIRTYQ